MSAAIELRPQDNLCFYLPSFAGGGAERFFIRLANQMASIGKNVHFVVNQANGPLRPLLSENVTLHVLGVPKAVMAVPWLVRYLKVHRPVALISALTRTNIAALLSARLAGTGTRVIVCERNQYSALLKELDPLRRIVMTWFVRRLYPSAHAVLGNTAEVMQDIASVASLGAGQIGLIYNPAPDPEMIEAAHASPAHHPWFSDDRPVAVAIGRLVPQKDYPTMLRAVAASGQDLRLMIMGEGPEKENLEHLARELGISERVLFMGFLMDRFSYLVQADLFLLSSRTEGFPNALIEAVSAGVPAISTDCAGGGSREILGREFPDRIVPVADPEAMAEVITRLTGLRDAAAIERDRRRSERIAARYQISEIADLFLAKALA